VNNLKVRNHMTSGVLTIDSSSSVSEACEIMRDNRISGLFVTSTGGGQGVFTDTDLVRLLSEGKGLETPLHEVMSREIVSVEPDSTLEEAAGLLRKKKVSRLFVFKGGGKNKPVGILSVSDVIRALSERLSFK